jgi:hypothetical protein
MSSAGTATAAAAGAGSALLWTTAAAESAVAMMTVMNDFIFGGVLSFRGGGAKRKISNRTKTGLDKIRQAVTG